MTSVKSLYLPVENLARELDGKLLLALVARERGWRPVLGHKAAIRGHRSILPPGIYLAHNARTGKAVFFERFGRFGHQSVVLDEEALVRQTDEIFLMKHEMNAFDKVSLLLTWGEDDAELWRNSRRIAPERVAVTGNPRMDLLRRDLRAFHQPEIAAIRDRFGDYVLLNTNFATVNHYVPWSSTLKLAESVTDARVLEQKSAFLDHKQALFERFRSLIPKLAQAIAPLALVVRPHPSERHEPWLEAVAGSPNASVVFEGSVVPWIAGARALIHNGCTSAVEAAVEGTAVLSYRPVTSECYDNPLPNAIGTECFSDEALLEALARELDREPAGEPAPLTESQQALLARYITLGSSGLCCDAIMDAIERRSIGRADEIRTPVGVWLKIFAANQRRLLKRRIKGFSSKGMTNAAYRAHKFPGLSAESADERIARFQAALSRFGGLRARELRKDVLQIVG